MDTNTPSNLVSDEYMDPAHMQLGGEKYRTYVRERAEKAAGYILEHLQKEYPSLQFGIKASAFSERQRDVFTYVVRAAPRLGFWKYLKSPHKLILVATDTSPFASAEVEFAPAARKFLNVEKVKEQILTVMTANRFSVR